MLSRAMLERDALQIWHAYHAPILAMGAALAASLLRRPAALAAASGIGALAGWAALTGAAALLHPVGIAERLPVLALACTAGAALAQMASRRATAVLPVLLALVCAWILAGTPLSGAVLMAQWPVLVGVTAAALLCVHAADEDGGWAPLAAALALWGGLMVLRGSGIWFPGFWSLAALVPAAALLPGLRRRGAGALASGAALVAVTAAAAELALGGLRWGRIGLTDAACLAPMAALLLMTRLRRLPGPVGAVLAAGACVVAIVSGRLLHLPL